MTEPDRNSDRGGDLGRRLLLSAILIPLLIVLFTLDARSGPRALWLLGLSLVLSLRATWEMVALLKRPSFSPRFGPTAVCVVGVVVSGWWTHLVGRTTETGTGNLGPVAVAFTLSVLGLFLVSAVRYREPGSHMERLAAELLIVGYVGLLLAVTAQLRWVAGDEAGYLALGSLVIAAKSGDIGAYTLGRLFGRRKMTPRLSPGKTWIGGLGAVLGAAAASWAWFCSAPALFNPFWVPCASAAAVLFGAVIGLVGLIGDLCESLIKRDRGHKDSASLLPGFGGILDLLDSVLYAGPVAYLLWQILPLVTW